jgi:hypothetical protein
MSIVEGVYDAAVLPEFIRKCRADDVEVVSLVCRGSVMHKFLGLLEGFRHLKQGAHVDKALVIRDADNRAPQELLSAMEAKYADRSYPFPVTPFVIVQKLETWLLADNTALSQVCNRAVPAIQETLEDIENPKERLQHVLAQASTNYTGETARKIAAATDIERLEYRCPGFQSFRQALHF